MAAHFARDWPYPRLVAHRGAGKVAPENTLTAMRVGHAHGYRMVEFDVKLAADNVSFLLHDATLERTTSGRGRADALLWRELSRLDAGGWHSAKYAGEPLPTLASIARWARAHSRRLQHRDQADPRARAGNGRRRRARCDDAVAGLRDAAAPLVVLRGGARSRARCLPRVAARAAAGECAGRLEGAPLASRMHRASTSTTRRSARLSSPRRARRGIAFCCYTPNSAERIGELAAWGVDGLITDAIDQIPSDSLPPAAPLPASSSG